MYECPDRAVSPPASDGDGDGRVSLSQAPTFSAFRPRDIRFSSQQAMNHIAWSCDGKKLGAVGIDKIARVWQPEKSVCVLSCGTGSLCVCEW